MNLAARSSSSLSPPPEGAAGPLLLSSPASGIVGLSSYLGFPESTCVEKTAYRQIARTMRRDNPNKIETGTNRHVQVEQLMQQRDFAVHTSRRQQ